MVYFWNGGPFLRHKPGRLSSLFAYLSLCQWIQQGSSVSRPNAVWSLSLMYLEWKYFIMLWYPIESKWLLLILRSQYEGSNYCPVPFAWQTSNLIHWHSLSSWWPNKYMYWFWEITKNQGSTTGTLDLKRCCICNMFVKHFLFEISK